IFIHLLETRSSDFCFSLTRRQPKSTLFPYTTLFRSGHQIMGLASGGSTYKLKFGHHGANHPVKDLATGKVEITAQNHGFAPWWRSEEHTSELQSRGHLVCRLLLEKKKTIINCEDILI